MAGTVVDASVFAAIVFREPWEPEATALVAGYEVYAPYLMAFEIANIAVKKITRNPSQRIAIFKGVDIMLSATIHWTAVDYGKTLGLALETGLTAYDASYLHLARTLGLPLATFDRKLSVAAQG